ncbi:MAG: sulfatase/phosphatase domain-containing protein, partial [Verrucomicrobiota bacterium]
ENTLILFASDNGAHKEGGHDPGFWNSSGDLKGHKRDMHEGGIRTPMLARWPGTISAGTTTAHLSGFQDILSTICELLGQPVPEQNDGLSFLPTLRGDSEGQKEHDYLYWEFCKGADQKIFSQALRQGNWKAFRLAKSGKVELYDLSEDPFEANDLAEKLPEKAAELAKLMEDAHTPLPTQE